MGAQRELKFALERYWRGETGPEALEHTAAVLRQQHWHIQRKAVLRFVTVGDFALYDHVLQHIQLLGCEPERFGFTPGQDLLERHFIMARGMADSSAHDSNVGCTCAHNPTSDTAALDMTKWFDTNYHYLVPEFHAGTTFRLHSQRLLREVQEAHTQGHAVKAAILGPLSFLWLGKSRDGSDRLALLERLLPVYAELLTELKTAGAEWVQIDEPILGLYLPPAWRHAFEGAYWRLN